MTKITPEHLARGAFVYVRQSTADQLLHNHESRRRQYGLVDRARQLGWQEIAVIDDDLGRSGSGVSRPGFERLLAAICEGRAGAVLAIEASRLARNGRDWHTLIEFCGLVGTIIIDEDGVYEPRHPNDRLLLGNVDGLLHQRHAFRALSAAPIQNGQVVQEYRIIEGMIG
jgi:DNA invertase Pin-like site-specific DNA recombinase